MNTIPDKSLIQRYLKKLYQLSKKRDQTVETLMTGKELQLDDIVSFQIELILRSEGLVNEPVNRPEILQVTEKGLISIRENKWLNKALGLFSQFYSEYLADGVTEYKKSIFYSLIFFLLFEVLEPFVNIHLTEFCVNKILNLFHPNDTFDVLVLIVSGVLIYRNYRRKPNTWDFFIMALYIKYRLFSSAWDFWPIFKTHSWNKNYVLYIDIIGMYFPFVLCHTLYNYITVKLNSSKPEYSDGFLYPDLPLNRLSSKVNQNIYELDKKGLNRNKFANQLADIITQIKPFQAFAIGISGPWGSGKTSLIHLILENLKTSLKVRHYQFIEFSPWYFNNSEMLITSFFTLLEETFKHNKTLSSELKAYSKEILMIEKSIMKTEFSKLLFETNKTLKARYESIIQLIKNDEKLLIITIDDLDRLDKKEIVDVFRLIRLIADFPNTFYLVAYDRGYINSAIENELTKYSPEKYADKIFNIEFKIPELNEDIIRERLKLSIENQITLLGTKAGKIVPDEMVSCFDYGELDKFIKNERNIKQFTNNLMIRYLSVTEEVNFYDFFLLELIYFQDAEIYRHLYQNRNLLYSKYSELMEGNSESDEINFGNILAIKLPDEIGQVLAELYRRNNHRNRYSIANGIYFARYFSLTLLSSDFSTQEFDAAFELPNDKFQIRLIELNSLNSSLFKDKLLTRFNPMSDPDKNQVTKILDGFLSLYNEIFYSKNEADLSTGLNRENLGKFVFLILKNSNKDIPFLKERILRSEVKDFAAFSYLLSAENILFIGDNKDQKQRREDFIAFREIQLQILKREVENSNGRITERIINQFQRLRHFTSFDKDNIQSKEFVQWFLDYVITGYKSYLNDNLGEIIMYIKSLSTTDEIFDLDRSKEITNSIFLDIESNQKLFKHYGLEKIVDFYYGFDTINDFPYSFHDKTPPNPQHPEINDDICERIFELKKGTKFEVTLEPVNTSFWRFGFRLSRTKEFSPILNSRHIDTFPFIHLSKGQIEVTGDGHDDSPEPNLHVGVYSGSIQEYAEIIIPNYQNGKITFSLFRGISNFIHIKVYDGNSTNSGRVIKSFTDFNFTMISAWADLRKFNITTRIKVLQQINPDLVY